MKRCSTPCRKVERRMSSCINLIRKLFWLWGDGDITLTVRRIPSGENSKAGKLTRPDAWEHVVRLRQSHFNSSWVSWGSFDTNLVDSRTSAQRAPTANGMLGPALTFNFRFYTDCTIGSTFWHRMRAECRVQKTPVSRSVSPPSSMYVAPTRWYLFQIQEQLGSL